MRLTKTMKDSLYTIIKNKSIPPFTTKDEEEFTKEIQEIVYKQHPIFKQYIDTYGHCSAFNKGISFSVSTANLKSSFKTRLNISIPDYFHGDRFEIFLKPENIKLQDGHNTRINNITKDSLKYFSEEYQEVFTKILNKCEESDKYDKVILELYDIIQTFTTDTALAQAYPEFEQFFLQAGITSKPKRALPSVTGLPDVLTKYGVKLKSDTTEDLAEEIKQEIIENERLTGEPTNV